MPPCGPHLTPLATGSLEQSLLVLSTLGGLTGDDLSCLFFTCTNTSQAASCTCITQARISPQNIVNHSSHKEATIHRSSNHTWFSNSRRGGVLSPRTPTTSGMELQCSRWCCGSGDGRTGPMVTEVTCPTRLTSRHSPRKVWNRCPSPLRGFCHPLSMVRRIGHTRVGGTVSRR
jgi:hypothetical protein